MMKNNSIRRHLLSFALIASSLGLFTSAAQAEQVEPKVAEKIAAALQKVRPEFQVTSVESAPIAGLYQAQLANGPMIYVTEDARYFVVGDLFEVTSDGLVNVTEFSRNAERVEALSQLSADDMIVFSPKGEVRAQVTVFTDIDCGFCRKLHQEVPELNEMGVEVRYLGYPRAGIGSDSYKKLLTAWCADNPQQVLTEYKNGKSVPFQTCDSDAVTKGYNLGRELGVNATPSLVFESGELQMGYMKAADLAARLGVK